MKIIVDDVITIQNPTQEIKDFCKNELEIVNPQYEQNKRLGFPVYNIPKKLVWWQRKEDNIIVPFGVFSNLYKLFPEKDNYEIKIKPQSKLKYKSNIKLYDYQETACNSIIKSKNGILVMPARFW